MFELFVALLGPSWCRLGALGLQELLGCIWNHNGQSWGRIGPSSGRLGGPLGPLGAWAVSERREAEKARKQKHNIENHKGQSTSLATRGPLGKPLGGGPSAGGLWARLGAILGVVERSFGVSGPGPSSGPLWCLLGPSRGPLELETITREIARSPR